MSSVNYAGVRRAILLFQRLSTAALLGAAVAVTVAGFAVSISAIAVASVAVTAVAIAGSACFGVVEDAAEEFAACAGEHFHALAEGIDACVVLADDVDASVGVAGDQGRIGYDRARRRVDDDIVVAVAELGNQLLCHAAAPEGNRVFDRFAARNDGQMLAVLVGNQHVVNLALAGQKVSHAVLGLGKAQGRDDRGVAQVTVNQQYVVLVVGKGDGQIGGCRCFALCLQRTGDEDCFGTVLLRLSLYAVADGAHSLHEGEGDSVRVDGNEGILLATSLLEHDGGKVAQILCVEGSGEFLLAADGRLERGTYGKIPKKCSESKQHADCSRLSAAGRVGRLRGESALIHLFEGHVSDGHLADGGIVAQDRAQNVVGDLRIFRLHGECHEVGISDNGGLDLGREFLDALIAHVLQDKALQRVAGENVGENLADLVGDGVLLVSGIKVYGRNSVDRKRSIGLVVGGIEGSCDEETDGPQDAHHGEQEPSIIADALPHIPEQLREVNLYIFVIQTRCIILHTDLHSHIRIRPRCR